MYSLADSGMKTYDFSYFSNVCYIHRKGVLVHFISSRFMLYLARKDSIITL
jgi:hypothetical protein